MGILEPKPNSGAKVEIVDVSAKDKGTGKGTDGSGGVGEAAFSSNIPYVVFIGQLSFDTTVEQIEAHLRRNGIEGDMRVRILTDKETGMSKGTAFAVLEGARELHKCIALHHSLLNGRRINIEKSCGGSNKDSRLARIKEKREEQDNTVRATIDRIMTEYEEKGIISIINLEDRVIRQFYSYTPTHVRQV